MLGVAHPDELVFVLSFTYCISQSRFQAQSHANGHPCRCKKMNALKHGYIVKVIILLLVLICDAVLNANIDHIEGRRATVFAGAGQLVVRLMALLMQFLLMWNTFVFRFGLLGVIWNQFKWLFITTFLSFFVTIPFRIVRIVRRLRGFSLLCSYGFFVHLQVKILQDRDVLDIWEDGAYRAFFVIHNLSKPSCLFLSQPLLLAFVSLSRLLCLMLDFHLSSGLFCPFRPVRFPWNWTLAPSLTPLPSFPLFCAVSMVYYVVNLSTVVALGEPRLYQVGLHGLHNIPTIFACGCPVSGLSGCFCSGEGHRFFDG
mgnify:CR=1 FL=1